MNICDKLKEMLSNFYNWLRPKEVEKPECVVQLLQAIYPTVNWNNVHFHQGLPWFIPASQADAITLPGSYDLNQIHIYFNDYDPCSCKGLATIVHEGCHALQYTNISVWGVGFFRLFMVQYFGCFFANSYEDNPMEVEAYKHDALFFQCCTEPVCDCSVSPAGFRRGALERLLNRCPDLVKTKSEFSYDCGLGWAGLGLILDLLITLFIPIIESVLFAVLSVLLLVTGIICGLVWLWNIFVAILDKICKWTIKWERKCKQWAQQTIQRCIQYRDDGYSKCSQYRDDGLANCSQYRDDGYNACCTWWPCSWACKAWVWVSSWVCVAWIWVSSWVCIAWVWLSSWVCIAWATFVSWVCIAFAWVIKLITCW